jgi:crotonobetainyl-CoA:carnitine CoA-transferase CaiB-like acyl-CoA transferase
MAQPLAGIRVLELGNFIAGPFCGMLLGDMGADVIKVEPPRSGEMSRATPPFVEGESAGFLAINRNKRSLVLDLKQPAAVEALKKLAATCDVFLENYRPGVLDKLGLGAADLKAINPRIVYVSVSGFGQTGPYRKRAAVNLIIEAFSGSLSVTGEPGEMPMRPGLQTGDVLGAMFATYAVLSGLVGQARTGEGRVADVSLVEASIASAMWETAEYLSTGNVPQPLGRRHRLTAPYQLFPTRDGAWIAIGAPNNDVFKRLMTAIGCAAHLDDPRFATYALRKQNESAIVAIVETATRGFDAPALESSLVAAGVPCARVNDYAQVFDDPQIASRHMVDTMDHPKAGAVRVVRNPVLFDHDGPGIRHAAPVLGQHSAEILAEAGYAADAIRALADAGATQLAA